MSPYAVADDVLQALERKLLPVADRMQLFRILTRLDQPVDPLRADVLENRVVVHDRFHPGAIVLWRGPGELEERNLREEFAGPGRRVVQESTGIPQLAFEQRVGDYDARNVRGLRRDERCHVAQRVFPRNDPTFAGPPHEIAAKVNFESVFAGSDRDRPAQTRNDERTHDPSTLRKAAFRTLRQRVRRAGQHRTQSEQPGGAPRENSNSPAT